MNIFDRVFAGRVIRDYGPLEEQFLGLGRIRKSLLLVERSGKLKVVFKFSGFFLCFGSVQYAEIPLERIDRLRQCLDDAETYGRWNPTNTKSAGLDGDFE